MEDRIDLGQLWRQLSSGNLNATTLADAAKTLLVVLGLAVSLGLVGHGLANPSSDPEAGGSSKEYVQPDPDIAMKLHTIGEDLNTAINTWRLEESMAPVFPRTDRFSAAQQKAQYNALHKTQTPSDENVSMLQHHMPLKDASGWAFAEAWRKSAPHMAVIQDPANVEYGLGIAYADGEVYVVIQFAR